MTQTRAAFRLVFCAIALSASLPAIAFADATCVETPAPVGTLLTLAERGDPTIAFMLGCRYALGSGGVRDDSEAVRWFRQAAEAGLAEAQYHLGFMYANGRGVVRDAEQAALWVRHAAEQGLAEAQYTLGTFYLLGKGVTKNAARGAEWLAKAAQLGHLPAQYNLGYLYEHGHGLPLNADRAQSWYRKAAKGGYEKAKKRLDALLAKLNQTAPRNTATATKIKTPAPRPSARTGKNPKRNIPPGADPKQLNPAHFTLQLVSHKSEQAAREFIRRHGLGSDATFFVTNTGASTWYKVIYGDYPDHATASAAIAGLPPALRAGKPWVRNIGRIQAEIR